MSWRLIPLSEVAPAKPLKKVQVSDDESVVQITLDHIESNTGRLLNKIYLPVAKAGSSTHWFDENHVLYSKLRPYLNKVYLPDEIGLGTTELVPLLPDQDRLDRKYLAYYLRSKPFVDWVSSQTAGAKMPRVSMKVFWDHCIPLPPLEEQKRIATILDKADAIRRKRQQAIQLADEFIRSVFLDMFGDPVTNSKGFEIKELSDFFIDNKNGTKCGPFGSALKKQEYTESGIPVWSMDNISLSGDFHDVPALWVSEEKFEELNSYSVLPGDVIISRAGTVGKMGVVRSHYEKSLISTNLIRVRFNERRLIPEYFVSLMTYCKGRVGRLKTGPDGAFTHMNTGILSSLTFPYPPVDLQKRFMEYRRKVISILDSSLEYEHEGLFALQSISRKAFSGTL